MTFTVLMRNPNTGLIGVATASRSLAVGNAVPGIRSAAGAVASQAWTNPALRGRILDELHSGHTAQEALDRLPSWDERPQFRQVAVLPLTGPPAAHSGADISDWAGHVVMNDAVVIGNLLASEVVLDAMRTSIEDSEDATADATSADFARRLVAVLTAGERAGGDARGRQSAAVLVTTFGSATPAQIDLRVDDHADPVVELARLVELYASERAESVTARTESPRPARP